MPYDRELNPFRRLSEAIAHDINNLLSGILGYSELLLYESIDDSLKSYVEEISGAAKQVSSLIQILLAFGDRYASRAEFISINNVIADIEKLLPRILGTGIHFTTTKDPELSLVKADSAQLKLALVALVIEIQKWMPEGGKITLSTENLVNARGASKDGCAEPQRHILVTAASSGRIAEEMIPEYLLKSRRAANISEEDSAFGVFGLGNLVRLNGGRLWLEEVAEQRLAIRMEIPAAGRKTNP